MYIVAKGRGVEGYSEIGLPDNQDEIKAGPPDADGIAALLAGGSRPPGGSDDPPYCGEIDIRIARDGTWFYRGSPIARERLVRLFSTALRREDDGRHYLVTPVEKIGIAVDDAPFVAVEMTAEGSGRDQSLTFRTNVGDRVTADSGHPIRVETNPETGEPAPYVLVRDSLEALIARPVFYEMVDLGVEEEIGGVRVFGVWSGGRFFPLGRLDEGA